MYAPTSLLREFLNEAGKPGIQALASELGYHWTHLYAMLRNESFRPAVAIAISTLLDRPIEDLFERAESTSESRVG